MFYFLILSLGVMFGGRPAQANRMVNCAGVDTCKGTGTGAVPGNHATNIVCTRFSPCNQPMRDLR
jgi:hypothetical protein